MATLCAIAKLRKGDHVINSGDESLSLTLKANPRSRARSHEGGSSRRPAHEHRIGLGIRVLRIVFVSTSLIVHVVMQMLMIFIKNE